MKKILLLILIPFFAQGQDFRVGLKVTREATLPSVQTVQENRNFESQGATTFGLQVIKEFNERVGIETGLYFLTRRFEDTSSNIKMVHKAIPILLRIKEKNFYIAIGPQLELYDKSNSNANKEDNDFSLSVSGNIGYSFTLSEKTDMFLEGRANLMTKQPYSGAEILLFNIGLGAGINFAL